MRNGSKQCPFCGSRFTFEDFELVDSMPAEQPCDGCVRLYAILEQSAKLKAVMPPEAETAAAADLSPAAILGRLLAGRRRAEEPEHDGRMAAAGPEAD